MSKTKEEAVTATVEAMTLETLMQVCGSKSAVIRRLAAEGQSRGQIAKFMGLRYQHVRNVLITPVKKA
jgi:hypothetical protein